MYYIALFPDENSTSVGNGDSATANSITFIQSLCTLLVLGNGIALFSKVAVWMRSNKPYVPPWTFCVWLGESFGAARALDICRVLLDLYRLATISRFGVTILIRINLPLSCIHFFLFYCLSDERGLPTNWNLI